MAYELHHICTFQNKQVENMVIELYRKDVVPDAIVPLVATGFRVSYLDGEGNKLDGPIACEATLSFWIPASSPLTYQDFIITFHDEWKIIAYDDAQIVFTGYLNPSEGECDFMDKPYELVLSAVDGLGFLKQQPFSTFRDNVFTDTHRLCDILYHIVELTGLSLPLEVRANIYESSMQNRDENGDLDFTSQCKLHYKSMLKDGDTFMSAWDVLMIICHQHFSFYQWQGHWVLNRFAEMQSSVGPTNWFTVYEKVDGVLQSTGSLNTESYGQVGRNRKIHPIDANARISSRFPIKSATHSFPFTVWEEIPTNDNFERGMFSAPLSGAGYTSYIVDNWQYGTFNSLSGIALNPTTSQSFRKSSYDDYGIETLREIVLQNFGGAQKIFLSQPVPARKGDKINIELDFLDTGGGVVGTGGDRAIFYVFLSPDGVRKTHTLVGSGAWKMGINFVEGRYESGDDEREFHTFSVNSDPMPFDGFFYVAFHNNKAGAEYHYANFNLEYMPFVANGFRQVLGDYWTTNQTENYKDVIEEEVGLSDSLIKVVKGSLFRLDGATLTTPSWYRYGYTEERHYKELINLGVYNHLFRRQWKITGTFGGTKLAPVSNPTLMEPLSFHKHWLFEDAPELFGVLFMLVPPLTIDYKEGQFEGTFVDCLNAENYDTGIPATTDVINNLVKLINNTTPEQWRAAAGAPPDGTEYFPPQANVYPNAPNTIRVVTTFDSSPYGAVDVNGVGNNPTITKTFEGIKGLAFNSKVIHWQLGNDVAIGNRFIISLYGVQVVYMVGGTRLYHEGNQTGDQHFFNYKFK